MAESHFEAINGDDPKHIGISGGVGYDCGSNEAEKPFGLAVAGNVGGLEVL